MDERGRRRDGGVKKVNKEWGRKSKNMKEGLSYTRAEGGVVKFSAARPG